MAPAEAQDPGAGVPAIPAWALPAQSNDPRPDLTADRRTRPGAPPGPPRHRAPPHARRPGVARTPGAAAPDATRGSLQLILTALGVLLVATVATIAVTLAGSGPAASSTLPHAQPTRAAYWTVHRGQTYLEIAARTGLTVDELETFNPYTDPNTITPGQRLKLRLHVPPPPPKRKGPRFWTIRSWPVAELDRGHDRAQHRAPAAPQPEAQSGGTASRRPHTPARMTARDRAGPSPGRRLTSPAM